MRTRRASCPPRTLPTSGKLTPPPRLPAPLLTLAVIAPAAAARALKKQQKEAAKEQRREAKEQRRDAKVAGKKRGREAEE